jgi:hypothetical protein
MGYIKKCNNGWLTVLNSKGMKVSLPNYLNVNVYETKKGREFFEVREGPLFGQKFSVIIKNNNSFIEKLSYPYKKGTKLTFHSKSKKLFIKDKEYKAISGVDVFFDFLYTNTISKGTYDIQIPDAPHKGGQNYLNKSKFAVTWFRLGEGQKDDRYLHCGARSAGCITVIDVDKWDEIYDILITSRKNKDDVAIVEVIESADD